MFSAKQLAFFSSFVDFEPRLKATPKEEFYRLANTRNWGSKLRNKYLRTFEAIEDDSCTDEANISGVCQGWGDFDLAETFRRLNIVETNQPNNFQNDFSRYAKSQKLRAGTRAYDKGYTRFITEETFAFYGTDDLLDIMQCVCRDADIAPVPNTKTQCRIALNKVYINVIDFIDCKRHNRPLKPVFRNYKQFCHYTETNNKFFKKQHAKNSPVLKLLLKVIAV